MTSRWFPRPKDQEPVGIECIVEERNDLPLQRLIKINQKIAAAHQIEPRERRIARHIVPGKDA